MNWVNALIIGISLFYGAFLIADGIREFKRERYYHVGLNVMLTVYMIVVLAYKAVQMFNEV